ncbi:MAG: FliA/WhiG family RNA polymerase sigma factor [Desulfobacterales bacterium]
MVYATNPETIPLAYQAAARENLITENLPMVKRIVYRIAAHLPPHVEIDDLMNAGVIGLVQAVDNFDPTLNIKLSTYASIRIRGAVLSELRSRDLLSRTTRQKVREMERVTQDLEQKLGREADDEEVTQAMGLEYDDYFGIKKMSALSFISLEDVGANSSDERRELLHYLVDGRQSDALSLTRLKEIKAALVEAITKLPEKEKLVISLYYQDDLTMKETGQVLNVTESRVSQIHSKAIRRLRRALTHAGLVGH